MILKTIKDFNLVETPVTVRTLKDAKCYCEYLKNPIGTNCVLKFHSFNHPKDYIRDKIREIKVICELEYFNKYGEEWVYFSYEQNAPVLRFKFSGQSINPIHFIENPAVPLLYVKDENKTVRFLSNFLIQFEIESVNYLR